MEEELAKFRKMAEELKNRIECTICMDIPMKGPVPVCPNGHFICSQCLDKREEDGQRNCATCQVPMGNSKSLLATVVIENVEHKCDFQGCDMMVHFKEYKKHQRQCENRGVCCPGRNCNKLLSFREVATHTKICPGIATSNPNEPLRFSVGADALKEGRVYWRAYAITMPFFFKMRKFNNMYSLEVVMLGSQEECDGYEAEISILNFKSNPVLVSLFPPRPISLEKWGDPCLTVTEKTMASIWRYSPEDQMHILEVKVNIYCNDEVGQGRAKKIRVEESEDESDNSDANDNGKENYNTKNYEQESNDDKKNEEEDDTDMDDINKEDIDKNDIDEDNIYKDDIDEDDIDEDDIDQDDISQDDIDQEDID